MKESLSDKLDSVLGQKDDMIEQRDVALSALDRNITILEEIVLAANATLNEFYKITSTYHKKILSGTATREDVMECSKITRRSVKHFLEMQKLQKYYIQVYKTAPQKDISLIKK